MSLTPLDTLANERAVSHGHRMQPETRPSESGWVCASCGMKGWFGVNFLFGPVFDTDCDPDAEPPTLPEIRDYYALPSRPLDREALARQGLAIAAMDIRDAAIVDGSIEVLAWQKAMDAFANGAASGASMFQRWQCGTCAAIQTMPDRNKVFTIGRCEECGSLTDLQVAGFAPIGIAAADPADEPRLQELIGRASAELTAQPLAYVVRHRAKKAGLCGNCGEPVHPGKPCDSGALRRHRAGR